MRVGVKGKLCKHDVAAVKAASTASEAAILHALGAGVGGGSHYGYERLLGSNHIMVIACKEASTVPDGAVARLLCPPASAVVPGASPPRRPSVVAAPADSPGTLKACRLLVVSDLQAVRDLICRR